MKPSPFDYVRASSVEHAVELLSSDADVRVLAGGQSLMPVLNLRLGAPDVVVDIGRLGELHTIELMTAGGDSTSPRLRIGAASTQTEAAANPEVQAGWPMLVAAVEQIGHPPIRNRGTVCGSLAHNDPQAELPAVALALDARLIARSPRGERSIAAGDFFGGAFMTALADDELLTAVDFPALPDGHGWSFREFAPRPGDFATAGIAALLWRQADRVESRIVAFAVDGEPRRVTLVEDVLTTADGPELVDEVIDRWAATLTPYDEPHASAGSRVQHARSLLVEAVIEAWGRMS